MPRLTSQVAGIPRGYPDHRRKVAREYARVCRELAARFPTLPPYAAVWLREAALAAVELGRLATDLEAARARCRVRLANSIRRQQHYLRQQLLDLEDRLASLAAPRADPLTPTERAAEVRRQIAEGAERRQRERTAD